MAYAPPSTGGLRARLEEAASAGPVLLSLDDLHWADPATLHALRSLPSLTASYPVAWILSRNTYGGSKEADTLFEVLEHGGAARVTLTSLAEEAQIALMTEALGSAPDTGLVDRAACAGGNPFLLTEFIQGMVDESAITITDGRATLNSRHAPERFRTVMRKSLGRLSAATRHLLQTGAVLGRSFRLDDAADMLGRSPGALLSEVEEGLGSRVIIATGDTLTFRHDLIWQIVTDGLPPPARQAMHRQAGKLLLARGDAAVSAAHHLLAGARPEDPEVLSGLDRAAAEALRFSSPAAAELAVRALDLTRPSDADRPARTVAAVRALTAVGLWDEADTLALPSLAVPAHSGTAADLRCALAALHAMRGRAAEALVEAETILSDHRLPAGVRDSASIVLLQALTGMRDNRRAAWEAKAILGRPHARPSDVRVAALLVLALVAWDDGRVADALDLASDAVRTEAGNPAQAQRFHPDLFLAARLASIHRFAEAEAVMNSIDRLDAPPVVSWTASSTDTLRAWMALHSGRLDVAASEAGFALSRASAAGTCLHNVIARTLLAAVALRRGDVVSADGYISESPASIPHFVAGYETSWSQVVAAQVQEVRNGPHAAVDMLASLYEGLDEHKYPLVTDPVCAPWLVRVALAAGDTNRAAAAAAAMTELARANPAVPLLHACADHARGILDGDLQSLESALAEQDDPWARASAAEDLGRLLAGSRRPDEAVGHFDKAMRGYTDTGADRDAARIRRALRQQGVRRRHWETAKRPPTGWEGLTDTERTISDMVAQGQTNQQVADQMFISAHTVSFHLRHIFRKLGIRSRVELTRVALRQPPKGERAVPDTTG
jgi:DNA-binding CsgD family transcriptional regulator